MNTEKNKHVGMKDTETETKKRYRQTYFGLMLFYIILQQ